MLVYPHYDVERMIEDYIDDGGLGDDMKKDKDLVFPIIKFYSFCRGIVRILVGGECPKCHANHVRNTCTHNFLQECVMPRLKEKFDVVAEVKAVNTHDPDFTYVVEELGGKVHYPMEDDVNFEFQDII